MAERGEAAEVEADAFARHIGSAAPARVQQSTGPQLARQPATATAGATSVRRIDASAASVSWIDPASPAGGHVTDPAPPATLTVPFVTGSSGFRFSNYLHGWCETADSVHLTNHGFETDSGIYRGPSYLGIPSHAYATSRSGAPFTDAGGIEGVEFEQLTGARTISAGVIGGAGGGLVGGAAGAAAAGFVVGGPVGAAVGGLIGGIVGWAAGSSVANRVTNFPPIWTRIRLRLKANGARSCQLVEQSVFPSSSFYCDLSQVRTYSALAPEQSRWEAGGWDAGNPWGASRPLVTP